MINKRRYFLVPIATAVATLMASPVTNANASNPYSQPTQMAAEGTSREINANLRPNPAQLITSEEIHSLTLSNSGEASMLASHRSHSSHRSHASHRSHFSSR